MLSICKTNLTRPSKEHKQERLVSAPTVKSSSPSALMSWLDRLLSTALSVDSFWCAFEMRLRWQFKHTRLCTSQALRMECERHWWRSRARMKCSKTSVISSRPAKSTTRTSRHFKKKLRKSSAKTKSSLNVKKKLIVIRSSTSMISIRRTSRISKTCFLLRQNEKWITRICQLTLAVNLHILHHNRFTTNNTI